MNKVMAGMLCFLFTIITANSAWAERVKAFVSIAPQIYFVQQIGRDLVDVSVLVPPGADPHTYEPKPGQMAGLAKSALYFAIGIDFEKAWMQKIAATNPGLRIVHTDAGIEKIPLAAHHPHEEEGHSPLPQKETAHHEQEAHPHDRAGAPDPHVWLSPPLVKLQARNIAAALASVDSANRTRYEENLTAFVGEIEALDAELTSIFAGRRGARFMVLHPSWGYFAQAYGLEQVPIEIEGKSPKPAELKRLIEHARQEGIKVIFVQPQFSAKSAEMVAREIGGQVVSVDPLAGNWAVNLREVARRLKAGLR